MEDTKLVQAIERAEEPGGLREGQTPTEKNDNQDGMTIIQLKGAGWTYVYNTETGARIPVNNNNLIAVLNKKKLDGTPRFSRVKPNVVFKRGTFKCILHKDNPDRSKYDEMGLAVCPKDNLNSAYEVKRHMTKRHKMEWESIEELRTTREREEDRSLQRALIEGVMNNKPKAEAPVYVSDNPPKPRKKRKVKVK